MNLSFYFFFVSVILNIFTGVSKKGCKENYHHIALILVLDACALSRARNQESRLGFPKINEKCFSWSIIFQPCCLEDSNNHTQNLFVRKQCVYLVRVKFQLQTAELALEQ